MMVTQLHRRWFLLGLLPLITGAVLVVHVLTGLAMGLGLVASAAIIGVTGVWAWRQMPPLVRREAIYRIRAGLLVGVLATLTYDAVRFVTVSLFHDVFSPFDIMPIFGRAITGATTATPSVIAVGWIYHYTNGICFAVAYALLFAARPWWLGVMWALGLEALMLTIYPGWLHPHPYGEFLQVSMVGHVAYGLVLGILSREWLARLHRGQVARQKSITTTEAP